MIDDTVGAGWKRFLDRLKQFWRRLGDSDLPPTTARTDTARLAVWEDEGGAAALGIRGSRSDLSH